MKRILSFLMVVVDLVFFNILPMPSVSERGIDSPEDPIYFTAHRGVNAKTPENSIPSAQMAIEMGYYSVETDVRLTKDKVWVVSHNRNIGKWYNGKVNVDECTYDELLQYKVKAGHGFRKYGTLRIPTMDEYLDVFVGTEARPQIEIKSDSKEVTQMMINDGHILRLLDQIEAKGLTEQAIVISFDLSLLQYIRANSDIEIWYMPDGKITPQSIEETKSMGIENTWISCCFEDNDVESMQLAKDAGIQVSMWTVDKIKDAKKLYEAGFRYMETDRLAP